MSKTDIKKDAVVEALEKSLGVITTACRVVGINRTTFYRWLNEDKEFRSRVEDIENVAIDFAESKLHEQIADNNTSATIFYLKTKGRKRGYIETQEIKLDDNITEIAINVKRNREEN